MQWHRFGDNHARRATSTSVVVGQCVGNRAARSCSRAAVGFAHREIGLGAEWRAIRTSVVAGRCIRAIRAIVAHRGGVGGAVHTIRQWVNYRHCKGAAGCRTTIQCPNCEGTGCTGIGIGRTHPARRACARVEARVGGHGFADRHASRALITSVGDRHGVHDHIQRASTEAAISFAESQIGRSVQRSRVRASVVAWGGISAIRAIISNGGGVADLVHACCHRIDDRNGERARTTGCARQAADGKRTRCASVAVRRTHPTCRACARVEGRVDGHGFAQHHASCALIAGVGVVQGIHNRAARRGCCAAVGFADAKVGRGSKWRGVAGGCRNNRRAVGAIVADAGGVADLADTGWHRIDHRHREGATHIATRCQCANRQRTRCTGVGIGRTDPTRRTCARIEDRVGGDGFAQGDAARTLIAGIGVTQRVDNRTAGNRCRAAVGFAKRQGGRSVQWRGVAARVVGWVWISTICAIIAHRGGVADLIHTRRNRIDDRERESG